MNKRDRAAVLVLFKMMAREIYSVKQTIVSVSVPERQARLFIQAISEAEQRMMNNLDEALELWLKSVEGKDEDGTN